MIYGQTLVSGFLTALPLRMAQFEVSAGASGILL